MAITLRTVAAPGATPIAVNADSATSFASNYMKLKDIPATERKTLFILSLIALLNSAGGANYTSNHAGAIQDAAVYTRGISFLDLATGLASTVVSDANTVSGQTLDLNDLLASGRDFFVLPESEQDRIISFLMAQLGWS